MGVADGVEEIEENLEEEVEEKFEEEGGDGGVGTIRSLWVCCKISKF